MNCKNCGAPMNLAQPENLFRCAYCDSIRLPKETDEAIVLLQEPTGELCPVCQSELIHCQVEEQPGGFCSECRGLLLAQKDFALAVRKRRARHHGPRLQDNNPKVLASRRCLTCPRCQRPMEAYPYLGPGCVLLDSCSACWLIWLDHGELTILQRS